MIGGEEIRPLGGTPNGGVRAVVYFRDEDGKPAPKDRATSVEIVEYDSSGREVFRTYGSTIADGKGQRV